MQVLSTLAEEEEARTSGQTQLEAPKSKESTY